MTSCESTKKLSSSKSKRLFTFDEARKIARGHGFDSKEEFIEYTCPGAYQIPKDADVVWADVSNYVFAKGYHYYDVYPKVC